ncbi:MAG TPA: phosphosulfolactate synthase [Chitinophagaceae bacterium]|nr:phosphosulfolactate synthase [Chitinophagaceae bacterium]
MNFNLSQIPQRTAAPRSEGLTVVSDNGLNLGETENFLSVAHPYVDMVKLAYGSSYIMGPLKEKLAIYRRYQVPVYLGGLLFEAFLVRNQFHDYLQFIREYGITHIEISDGSINLSHADKCRYIEQLSRLGVVLSGVGSKDKDRVRVTPPYKWIEMMKAELAAGARYVIAEARENGTVGLYRDSGEVREGLVQEILTKIPASDIIWEAPKKDQQLFFIKLLGCNVNLGNIAPGEVIPLETMRIGLRSDTFHVFLDKQQIWD